MLLWQDHDDERRRPPAPRWLRIAQWAVGAFMLLGVAADLARWWLGG